MFKCRVFPLKRAAQEKAQAERAAAVSSFKSLLQDKGDVTSISRWSKASLVLCGVNRYNYEHTNWLLLIKPYNICNNNLSLEGRVFY